MMLEGFSSFPDNLRGDIQFSEASDPDLVCAVNCLKGCVEEIVSTLQRVHLHHTMLEARMKQFEDDDEARRECIECVFGTLKILVDDLNSRRGKE